ncbi:LPS translocon maturation chaperone LptM [Hydrogenophaga sp. XSHU_21]
MAFALLLTGVAACGQRGPLVLPAPAAPKVSTDASPKPAHAPASAPESPAR